MLGSNIPIQAPLELPPQLIVVIDTEEEFDWSAAPNRNETSVSAMRHMDKVQTIFDDYGIKPCYVVDYPIVDGDEDEDEDEGTCLLKEYHRSGRCEIGAHLHPWVNPPFDEEVTIYNTYAGNLNRDLEFAKLQILSEKIKTVFGDKPTIYKAGRYGLGVNSVGILEELGFEIDLSVCPPVDYRADGGPDYSRSNPEPCWFGSRHQLLEIPVTGAFVGCGGSASRALYSAASRFDRFKAKGILARLSVVDRLMLSPEGFNPKEHIKITEFLLKRGVRTFTWSFHSTSVEPAMAPYVKTEADLTRFLDSFRGYFDYFFTRLGGETTTPTKLKQILEVNK